MMNDEQSAELVDRLEDEIRTYVLNELGSRKGVPAASRPLAEILINYNNWRNRQIEQRPRAVHRAPNLIASSKATEYADELDHLIVMIRDGDDLTPLLSRGAQKVGKNDGMLADWGIQHLHFTPAGGPDILFGVFQPDDAYLIGIYPHNSWTVKEAVEIIVRTWPEANIFNAMQGLSMISPEPSDAERADLRQAGVSTSMVQVDGVTYISGTIGQTMAGGAIQATRKANLVMHVLRDLRENLPERLEHFRDHVQQETGTRPTGPWEPAADDGKYGLIADGVFVPLGDLG